MPITRFYGNQSEIINVLKLPEVIYYPDEAKNIPIDPSQQTQEQQQYAAEAAAQIRQDLKERPYIDLTGRRVGDLKDQWLKIETTETESNRLNKLKHQLTLADGVYPFKMIIPSVASIGASMGHMLYPREIGQEEDRATSFFYMTDSNLSAEFSLRRGVDGNWLITSIIDAASSPEFKEVTVLSSFSKNDLCNENEAEEKNEADEEEVSQENFAEKLQEAIGNEAIFKLIVAGFRPDGSIDLDYFAQLDSRLKPNTNLDNRDKKNAQLEFLFSRAEKINDPALTQYIAYQRSRSLSETDFFKDGEFEIHLDKIANTIAMALQKKLHGGVPEEMKMTLKTLSKEYANLVMGVEESRFDTGPFLGGDYPQQARQVKEKIFSLQVGDNFGFGPRNFSALVYGTVFGLMAGVAVAMALTGVLAPIAVLAISVASAVLSTVSLTAYEVSKNERRHQSLNAFFSNKTAKVEDRNDKEDDQKHEDVASDDWLFGNTGKPLFQTERELAVRDEVHCSSSVSSSLS